MPADEFLRGRQAETGTLGTTRHQRIKDGILQPRRDSWSVILDLDTGNRRVARVANREIHDRARAQRDFALPVERCARVLQKVQDRLHHLIAVQQNQRQSRIVIPANADALPAGLKQPHDVLEKFVHIDGLFIRGSSRAEHCVDQIGEAVGFADDDTRVFPQLFAVELPFQQLRRAAEAAERIFYFMPELPDHLPPGAVLNNECIFPAYPGAAGDVSHFDQDPRFLRRVLQQRYGAIDHALLGVNLRAPQPHFIRVGYAAFQRAIEDVLEVPVVAKQLQQRLTERAQAADAEQTFRRGVHVFDKQTLTNDDDGRVQVIEHVTARRRISAVPGFFRWGLLAG